MAFGLLFADGKGFSQLRKNRRPVFVAEEIGLQFRDDPLVPDRLGDVTAEIIG